MDEDDPFHVSVAQLLAAPGERKEVNRRGEIGQVSTTTAEIVGDSAQIKLTLEALTSGEIAIYGEVSAEWQGECRRCLEEVTGEVVVRVKEIFESSPTEGETYKLDGDSVHLREMTREALLLHLPLAPLCAEDCAGPVLDTESSPVSSPGMSAQSSPVSSPRSSEIKLATQQDEQSQKDPRWQALDDLEF